MTTKTVPSERRRFARNEQQTKLAINLLEPEAVVASQSVNLSEGGLCLRMSQGLEVRSLVRMQLSPESGVSRGGSAKGSQALQCKGRVAWVIQRLDLRTSPPFLYDIGIEFVDPPPALRALMAQMGAALTPLRRTAGKNIRKGLEPAYIKGRAFTPRLERDTDHAPPWHLVVSVDSVPCFSGHYASSAKAKTAWNKFKRNQAKR